MENLMKKAKLFCDFFFKENVIERKKIMHIIYLYDEDNIDFWNMEFPDIEKSISSFIQDINVPENLNNFIFQIAYFDKVKYNQKLLERIEELKNVIKDISKNK